MDNRIANDMISSGMIPSGEKKKEDLSRTQYGSAPSPNKLMDAYKSMYDKKEEVINEMAGVSKIVKGGRSVRSLGAKKPEGSFLSRQKAKLAAETGKKPTPKVYGQTPTEVRTRADKDSRTYAYRPSDADNPRDFAIAKKPETTVTQTSDADKAARRARVKEMESQGKVRKTSYEKVDLLAAYREVYEHHKKDADGNTIPHEDEEIDEAVVSGTLAALKLLGTKAAKLGVKAGAKLGGKTGANMMKSVARNPMGAIDNINRVSYAAQTVGNMVPKGVPAVTKKQSQGGMVSADVDLFDIVKGQLLDEGMSEEEIKDIMLTLTPDEIMSEMAVNPNIAAMDAKNKADMIARAQANKVPDKVREASKRQMKAGTPREDKNNPYTTQDKKTIIDYNKNK